MYYATIHSCVFASGVVRTLLQLFGLVAVGMIGEMLDPFATDAFSMVSLTLSLNKMPNQYGKINDIGLMPEDGVTTRTIAVEERNNVLTLLPTKPVGSPGSTGTIGKRKIRTFIVPHIPHDDVVLPAEVQNVRAFGSTNQ